VVGLLLALQLQAVLLVLVLVAQGATRLRSKVEVLDQALE
jgi:hypothetical protein